MNFNKKLEILTMLNYTRFFRPYLSHLAHLSFCQFLFPELTNVCFGTNVLYIGDCRQNMVSLSCTHTFSMVA